MKRIAARFIAADGPVATTAQKMIEVPFLESVADNSKFPDDPMRASIYEAPVITTESTDCVP